jgi:hypothetical protein
MTPGSAVPPPGWYPDPAGRFQVRWWDGSTWTSGVASAGVQITDPVPVPTVVHREEAAAAEETPTAGDAGDAEEGVDVEGGELPESTDPSAPILDIEFKINAFRKERIILSLNHIESSKTSIPFDDIESVAYMVTRHSTYGVPVTTVYEFHFESRRGNISFKTGVASAAKADVKAAKTDELRRIIAVSEHIIEPRLRERYVATLLGGATANCGGVDLSRTGLRVSKLGAEKQVPWADVVGAHFKAGHVVVMRRDPNDAAKAKVVTRIPMRRANSVLLPRLLPQLKAAVG